MRSFLVGSCIVLLVVAAVSFSVYRGIVSKRAAIAVKWDRVEARLDERNLLIPLLEQKLYDHAGHEDGMFSSVSEAEAGWKKASGGGAKINAALALDAALVHLLKTAGNYSNLESDPEYAKLMKELAVREEKVASARNAFNKAVKEYNSMINFFPGNLLASRYGFKPLSEYHKLEQKATKIGRIKL